MVKKKELIEKEKKKEEKSISNIFKRMEEQDRKIKSMGHEIASFKQYNKQSRGF